MEFKNEYLQIQIPRVDGVSCQFSVQWRLLLNQNKSVTLPNLTITARTTDTFPFHTHKATSKSPIQLHNTSLNGTVCLNLCCTSSKHRRSIPFLSSTWRFHFSFHLLPNSQADSIHFTILIRIAVSSKLRQFSCRV